MLKSPEVYRIIRQELGPPLKELGFTRKLGNQYRKGHLSWGRPVDKWRGCVVAAWVAQPPVDHRLGSAFTFERIIGPQSDVQRGMFFPGDWDTYRRFPEKLEASVVEAAGDLYQSVANRIIEGMGAHPLEVYEHLPAMRPDRLYKPTSYELDVSADLFMPYLDGDDVLAWCTLVRSCLADFVKTPGGDDDLDST